MMFSALLERENDRADLAGWDRGVRGIRSLSNFVTQ